MAFSATTTKFRPDPVMIVAWGVFAFGIVAGVALGVALSLAYLGPVAERELVTRCNAFADPIACMIVADATQAKAASV